MPSFKAPSLLRAAALAASTLALLHTPAVLAAVPAADVALEVTMQRVWQFAHQPGVPGQ